MLIRPSEAGIDAAEGQDWLRPPTNRDRCQVPRYASTARTRRLSSSDGCRPSRWKIDAVCLATACSEITSCWPMAALERPSAIRPSTSRSRAERADGIVAGVAGQQAGDHLWVHGRPTGCDPPYRFDELATIKHPVLQEIANATRAVGQQFAGVQLLDVLGQHQDGQSRHLLPRRESRPDALIGESRRESDVDDGEIGWIGRDGGDEIVSVADGRTDL